MKKPKIIIIFALFSLSWALFGADIAVSSLELASRGTVEDGNFGMSSSMEADISLSGGYKYGITLGLGAEISNLEKALSYRRVDLPNSTGNHDADYLALVDALNERNKNQTIITIRSVEATMRDVGGKPLEISFFTGHYDKLGSGEDFQKLFDTVPVETGMRGFYYYPDGMKGDLFLRFNGSIHSIFGTGLAFKTLFQEKYAAALYIYHDLSFPSDSDGSYSPGHYSADFKVLANFANGRLEAFTGLTSTSGEKPVFRGGVLGYFDFEKASLLMQAGIPFWQIGESLGLGDSYFLVEPRFRLGPVGAHLTFFFHPFYYMNQEISNDREQRMWNTNLKFFIGDVYNEPFEAGVEATTEQRSTGILSTEILSVKISPFIKMATSGLLWDFKIGINTLGFVDEKYLYGKGLVECFIGIRTAF